MDLSWQIRLTLGLDGEGQPTASVETSRLDGRSHSWQGIVRPGVTWEFTDQKGTWPGRLVVQLEPAEVEADHPPHTSS